MPDTREALERLLNMIDTDGDGGFCVTGCAPKYRNTPMAEGLEIFNDEWLDREFYESIP